MLIYNGGNSFENIPVILSFRNWSRVMSVVRCGSFAVDGLTKNSGPGSEDAGGVVQKKRVVLSHAGC